MKASRRRPGQEETAAAVARGRARLGVPVACYVLVTVVAVAGVGAGVFCLVALRRWEALAAASGVVAAVFACNVRRSTAEAERFFQRLPDTVFDQSDMPIGELVKITDRNHEKTPRKYKVEEEEGRQQQEGRWQPEEAVVADRDRSSTVAADPDESSAPAEALDGRSGGGRKTGRGAQRRPGQELGGGDGRTAPW
ncbi:hypothetical protein ABZP36_011001 [Zizania latifolia]